MGSDLTTRETRKMATETKERKIMTKTVEVKTSKKGNRYLTVKGKDDKWLFVNLVKDNKVYIPTIPKSARELEVNFTSYKYDDENSRLVLFGVTDLVFKG